MRKCALAILDEDLHEIEVGSMRSVILLVQHEAAERGLGNIVRKPAGRLGMHQLVGPLDCFGAVHARCTGMRLGGL